MKAKWIVALSALTLVAAPATAQAARSLAPVSQSSAFTEESELPGWLIFAGILVGAAILIIDKENDDNPVSP